MPELPLCPSVAAAAATAGLPARVRIIPDDVQDTLDLLRAGAPLGWACYGGHVGIARDLLRAGADRHGTDAVLWRGLPPLLVAAEAGQEAALDFMISEARCSVHTTCEQGLGVLYRIHRFDDWDEHEGIVACERLARERGAKEQYIKWK